MSTLTIMADKLLTPYRRDKETNTTMMKFMKYKVFSAALRLAEVFQAFMFSEAIPGI